MLEQTDIDALLASATSLAEETGKELGAPAPETPRPTPGPTPARRVDGTELERILHMRFPLLVVLAERKMCLQDILGWTIGSIVEFEQPSDSEPTLAVGNRCIGNGQAVKVGEYFGLRITNMQPVTERIRAMGA